MLCMWDFYLCSTSAVFKLWWLNAQQEYNNPMFLLKRTHFCFAVLDQKTHHGWQCRPQRRPHEHAEEDLLRRRRWDEENNQQSLDRVPREETAWRRNNGLLNGTQCSIRPKSGMELTWREYENAMSFWKVNKWNQISLKSLTSVHTL